MILQSYGDSEIRNVEFPGTVSAIYRHSFPGPCPPGDDSRPLTFLKKQASLLGSDKSNPIIGLHYWDSELVKSYDVSRAVSNGLLSSC